MRNSFPFLLARSLSFPIYRLRASGVETLPATGFLLVSNHVTYLDSIVIQAALKRPIRFLVHESIYRVNYLTPILKTFGVIPISTTRAKAALRAAATVIEAGEVVCVFPEGELNRSRDPLISFQPGFELIASLAKCLTVPVWIAGLRGSIYLRQYGHRQKKHLISPVTVAFGKPIDCLDAKAANLREKLLLLREQTV
ncbi:MAG: 1-acyl-sn-glycerol-3-phosphate acyltransferase [Verrucomicrobia bacterium]|nr:1-acyl-sn-glycerol-3-phosphate acyltransferase [Verrucomicrobiota bacterium]